MRSRQHPVTPQATIDQLERELSALGPYREIAQAIRERTVDEAERTGDVEAAFRDALATVEREQRARLLLAAFDALTPTARLDLLHATFGDDELRELLESRRREELHRARHETTRANARADGCLDTRQLHSGELVTIGLFQRRRVDSGLAMGSRSDFCTRQLVLRTHDAPDLRVIGDRLMLRGAYDGMAEYPRREWEQERLTNHHIVQVGVTVVEGEDTRFDPAVYPGSTLDVRRGEATIRTRLLVGYVEIDGLDVFTP